MGNFFPRGCSSSSLVLSNYMNTNEAPCYNLFYSYHEIFSPTSLALKSKFDNTFSPALFLSRKPWMGDFSPRGCSSSSLVLSSCTNTTVTPCSGKACNKSSVSFFTFLRFRIGIKLCHWIQDVKSGPQTRKNLQNFVFFGVGSSQ